MSVLDDILADARKGVEARRAERPEAQLARSGAHRAAAGDRRSLRQALAAPGLSVIAEHKRSSPSAGRIRDDLSIEDVVTGYERAGASALSVLTEETRFGGSIDDLAAARAASRLPILRKDFIVDAYQVHEALAAGADAILLIVAALDDDTLAELNELAIGLELDVLVEVHDAEELARAVAIEPAIVGINNRNLATLRVDPETTYRLLPDVPTETIVVAESGLRDRSELERLHAAGVHGVLVGEALMRAPDVEAACRALTGIGTAS